MATIIHCWTIQLTLCSPIHLVTRFFYNFYKKITRTPKIFLFVVQFQRKKLYITGQRKTIKSPLRAKRPSTTSKIGTTYSISREPADSANNRNCFAFSSAAQASNCCLGSRLLRLVSLAYPETYAKKCSQFGSAAGRRKFKSHCGPKFCCRNTTKCCDTKGSSTT